MNDKTFVKPEYRKTSAGHQPIDGVQFFSYSVGVLSYARISEDGQIMTRGNSRLTSYTAAVIGHGPIINASGKPTRFRTQEAAARAGVKKLREMRS